MALVVAEHKLARILEAFGTALRSRGLSEKSVASYLGQVGRLRAGACSPAVRSTPPR
ncbi:MAG: hypothetical protein AB1503_06830 [Bacillota bacterium]